MTGLNELDEFILQFKQMGEVLAESCRLNKLLMERVAFQEALIKTLLNAPPNSITESQLIREVEA